MKTWRNTLKLSKWHEESCHWRKAIPWIASSKSSDQKWYEEIRYRFNHKILIVILWPYCLCLRFVLMLHRKISKIINSWCCYFSVLARCFRFSETKSWTPRFGFGWNAQIQRNRPKRTVQHTNQTRKILEGKRQASKRAGINWKEGSPFQTRPSTGPAPTPSALSAPISAQF